MKTMSVTRHRPAVLLDEFERTTYNYDDTVDTPMQALWVNRSSSTELTEGRLTVTEEARGVLQPDADITTNDELTALGVRWRVVGVLPIPKPTDPDVSWGVRVDLRRGE